jgi:hypothetical protein
MAEIVRISGIGILPKPIWLHDTTIKDLLKIGM